MQLSVTSIFSILFFSLVFAIIVAIILENTQILKRVKYEGILVCLAVPVIKMLFPVEIIPWTINLNVQGRFAEVIWWLNKKMVIANDFVISRWALFSAVIVIIGLLNVVRILISYFCFVYHMRKMPDWDNKFIQALVSRIMKEYGRRKEVSVKRTRLVSAPMILGISHPMILIPDDMPKDLNMEGILRHEIAHLMQGDLVIKLVWNIVKAWSFWNPIIFILDSQLIKILEVRADEKAIHQMTDVDRHDYRASLAILANYAGKKKGKQFGVALVNPKGMLVEKRIDVMEEVYHRTDLDMAVNYFCVIVFTLCAFVVMNCIILEPMSAIPVEDYEKTQMMTEDNGFLIQNEDGTYDMYFEGKFRATLPDAMGSRMKIYNSLEEAKKHEEIRE